MQTYHNCNPRYTGTSHDYQTGGIYPCLNASIFNPKELDTEQWMAASASLGVKEICLTAKHAGGFCEFFNSFV
jgi:alpha-L-fucosidase